MTERTARSRRTVGAVIAVLAMAAALGACGSDDDQADPTQPAPDVTTFQQGVFGDLPQVPGSEPFGERSEKDGVVTQTFKTKGITEQGVIDYYAQALPERGWVASEPVFREDTPFRADWVKGDLRLEISAAKVEDRDTPSAEQTEVQYSLVLRPT